jgi:hypothetical protein
VAIQVLVSRNQNHRTGQHQWDSARARDYIAIEQRLRNQNKKAIKAAHNRFMTPPTKKQTLKLDNSPELVPFPDPCKCLSPLRQIGGSESPVDSNNVTECFCELATIGKCQRQ